LPEVIAICHPEGGSPGIFEEAARASGASIREWHPAQEPEPPIDPGEAAGVLVLGGDQNVDEQHLYPYLTREIAFLKEWAAADRPVFGVCLGAQLLAEATGGAVVRAPEREFGWLGVEVLPAGMDDPVTGFGDRRLTALQWHDYAIDPPPGATVLASSDVCLQAFRLGEAWGVQFHPEVTGAILDEWLEPLLSGEQGPGREQDAREMLAGVPAHLADWNAYGRGLFSRFLERCR